MHSNQYYEQVIQQLNQQINYLQQYVHHKNVFEYHIHGVHVEKVSGTLQLGHLLEKDLIERDGIHRFYIGEIKIKEIEGTGVVGLGLTEKGDPKAKKMVAPEEGSAEIQQTYNDIKTLLAVEHVPTFFQRLAVNQRLLEKVWKIIEETSISSLDLQLFYEEVLYQLNKQIDFDINNTEPRFGQNVYISLAGSIEAQAKTLLIIVQLLEALLPGYIDNYQSIKLNTEETQITPKSENEEISAEQIKQHMKSIFQLDQLPSSFEVLDDNAIRYLYYDILQPLITTNEMTKYFTEIHQLLINKTTDVSAANVNRRELSTSEQGILFSILIQHLDQYQSSILLEYLLLYI